MDENNESYNINTKQSFYGKILLEIQTLKLLQIIQTIKTFIKTIVFAIKIGQP